MPGTDYYSILGVDQNASEADLKSAYREKAKKWHPDRNPGDAEAEIRFKEANLAYETLSDPEKRRLYDLYGEEGLQAGGMNGGTGGFGSDFASTMSDIFEDFFNINTGSGRSSGRERGADLRYDIEISLEDAFNGSEMEVEIPSSVVCKSCEGSGAKSGSEPSICRTCSGRGKVRSSQGFFTLEQTCLECQGRGSKITDPCTECRGNGRKQENKKLSVNIPKGIEEGTRIRVANEGEAGFRGGPPGDLYIFLTIKPHEFYSRDGADLYCRVPVTFATATLGGQFDVPGVNGELARVKVPEGTQSGKRFRLKGKGMPVLRSRHFGDMYVQVVLETPRNLNKKQKELLQEFDDLTSSENHPESQGFLSKVKEFLEGLGI